MGEGTLIEDMVLWKEHPWNWPSFGKNDHGKKQNKTKINNIRNEKWAHT